MVRGKRGGDAQPKGPSCFANFWTFTFMRTPEFTCLAPLRWTFTSCARGVVTCKDREVILSVVVICVEFLKSDQT